MNKSSDPIQKQLREARRSQILTAAAQVFAQRGFHKSTTKEIAKTAGVADGTVYNYFKDKDALLFGLLHRLNENPQRPEDLAEAAHLPFETFFKGYLSHRMGELENQITILKALLPELLVSSDLQATYRQDITGPTFLLAEQYFEKLRGEGKIRDLPVDLSSRVLAASVLGLTVLRLLGDQVVEEKWTELGEVLSQVLLHGLKGEDHE